MLVNEPCGMHACNLVASHICTNPHIDSAPTTEILNIPVAFLQFSPLYFDVLFGQLAIEVQRDIEATVASGRILHQLDRPIRKSFVLALAPAFKITRTPERLKICPNL